MQKKHEKLVKVLLSILAQRGTVKFDDFGKVVKHAVTGTLDNDGNCRRISQLYVRLNIHYQSSYPLTSHITSCSDLCEGQMVTLATGDSKKPRKTVLQCAITGQIN